jgi:hypothetical protein
MVDLGGCFNLSYFPNGNRQILAKNTSGCDFYTRFTALPFRDAMGSAANCLSFHVGNSIVPLKPTDYRPWFKHGG